VDGSSVLGLIIWSMQRVVFRITNTRYACLVRQHMITGYLLYPDGRIGMTHDYLPCFTPLCMQQLKCIMRGKLTTRSPQNIWL
jgi:hypothetical protein